MAIVVMFNQVSVDALQPDDPLPNKMIECLQHLEDHLFSTKDKYICGQDISLADAIIWATLYILAAPQAKTSAGKF